MKSQIKRKIIKTLKDYSGAGEQNIRRNKDEFIRDYYKWRNYTIWTKAYPNNGCKEISTAEEFNDTIVIVKKP
ncbi:hypothetical protein PO124_34925 [Bacillus licheniformis]|nr:hypothetical protein [Bacillus licheniformis]